MTLALAGLLMAGSYYAGIVVTGFLSFGLCGSGASTCAIVAFALHTQLLSFLLMGLVGWLVLRKGPFPHAGWIAVAALAFCLGIWLRSIGGQNHNILSFMVFLPLVTILAFIIGHLLINHLGAPMAVTVPLVTVAMIFIGYTVQPALDTGVAYLGELKVSDTLHKAGITPYVPSYTGGFGLNRAEMWPNISGNGVINPAHFDIIYGSGTDGDTGLLIREWGTKDKDVFFEPPRRCNASREDATNVPCQPLNGPAPKEFQVYTDKTWPGVVVKSGSTIISITKLDDRGKLTLAQQKTEALKVVESLKPASQQQLGSLGVIYEK